ncbi:hypothetical protein [Azospirillum sp.]|uniref:hypothetical protein n=1 Tax=Azospirillum sp. TaxID=34012 RepID=UPI002D6FAD8D|nr:hypothetical protein [Azospirillum sp.]HYD67434.1 hypothetical protein [Azospirillum sp.]
MSAERIVRRTADQLGKGKTDWARVEAMTEEDVERAVPGDPDANPPMPPDAFERGFIQVPLRNRHRWVRLDEDVAAWIAGQGGGLPDEAVNAILRAHMARKDAAE